MPLVERNVPLAPLTTMGVGGSAAHFVRVSDEVSLRAVCAWAREEGLAVTILAGGSNCVVSDKGVSGVVVHVDGGIHSLTEEGAVHSFAGVSLQKLVYESAQAHFKGLESLAGIPGSIGGAVRGNAGAFGVEIKDILVRVSAYHLVTGEVRTFTREECAFAYRSSYFKSHPEWVIVHVTLALSHAPDVDVMTLARKTEEERERRHLQNVPCAGSFFINPIAPQPVVERFEKEKQVTAREGRVPAGWLIEASGMRGEREGGVVSSIMHANYLVNEGGATSKDVEALAGRIKTAVHEQYGVTLMPEVSFL